MLTYTAYVALLETPRTQRKLAKFIHANPIVKSHLGSQRS
jgi:hypothetical protein